MYVRTPHAQRGRTRFYACTSHFTAARPCAATRSRCRWRSIDHAVLACIGDILTPDLDDEVIVAACASSRTRTPPPTRARRSRRSSRASSAARAPDGRDRAWAAPMPTLVRATHDARAGDAGRSWTTLDTMPASLTQPRVDGACWSARRGSVLAELARAAARRTSRTRVACCASCSTGRCGSPRLSRATGAATGSRARVTIGGILGGTVAVL